MTEPPSEFEVALDQTPAPLPEASEAELIAAVLEDDGIVAPRQTVLKLEQLLHHLALRLGCEAMQRIFASLDGTPAAKALQRAIGRADGSLAEAADLAGCARQSIHRSEQRIKKRLARLTARPPIETHERNSV